VPDEHLAWLVVAANYGLVMQAYLDPKSMPENLGRVAFGYVLSGRSEPSND